MRSAKLQKARDGSRYPRGRDATVAEVSGPIRVLEVELARPLPSILRSDDGQRAYAAAHVLVRLHREPLGVVRIDLDGGDVDAAALGRRINRDLASRISAHLRHDGVPGAPPRRDDGSIQLPPACLGDGSSGRDPPTASVIVCTRDRPGRLRACLASLVEMRYPHFEVVVVDSAPTTSATHDVVGAFAHSDVDIRYMCEQQPGLARARNRGATAAAGQILAFTDDDVVADSDWLAALTAGFARTEHVACATGLSQPAELETAPQIWFEESGGFGRQFEAQIFDRDSHRSVEPLYPYRIGWYGSGLNMAFSAAALQELGGFDEHLGAGTPVGGGEDQDAFLRVILSGRRLVHEPGALVWHYHRRDLDGLRRQLRGSGRGLSAILTKQMLESETRRDLYGRLGPGLTYLLAPSSPKNRAKTATYPRSLTAIELLGVAEGPVVYLLSRSRGTPEPPRAFKPALMAEVELTRPLELSACEPGRSLSDYRRALALVRLHTHPLGMVELEDPADTDAAGIASQVWRSLQEDICGHLREDGEPELGPPPVGGYEVTAQPHCLDARRRVLGRAPSMSVVVPTRDRPQHLDACLEALSALEYPAFEVIVVDNAPSSSATRQVVERRSAGAVPLTYVREDRPGASAARNKGLRAASGDFVAFADDDVIVDRAWLAALAEAFEVIENVGCVTGPVLPLRYDTLAQAWMEQFAEFRSGFTREVFDLTQHRSRRPLYPYNPGVFGSGGSMAFRRTALDRVGGFDTALGPATRARAGEELAAFLAVVLAGYRIVFEPAALVRHSEILEYEALRDRAYAYGIGLTAFLTKTLLDRPHLALDLALQVPYGLYLTLSSHSPKHTRRASNFPPELNRAELRGMLKGPLAYVLGRTLGAERRPADVRGSSSGAG
jgi:GT2 family glycosyltransferase